MLTNSDHGQSVVVEIYGLDCKYKVGIGHSKFRVLKLPPQAVLLVCIHRRRGSLTKIIINEIIML